MEALKKFSQMQPMQKIFLIVAIATILCSIFTDCVLCKYWPLTVDARLRNPFEHFAEEPEVLSAWVVNWCKFCQSSAPEFDKLAALYASDPKIKFEKVNAEENEQAAKDAGVDSYPTITLKKNGKYLKYTGERTAAAIKAWADAQ